MAEAQQEEQFEVDPEIVGEEFATWELSEETVQPKRTLLWYFIFGFVILLAILYSLFEQNFLFAVIVVIFAFVLVFERFNQAAHIKLGIYEAGVVVDGKFYPYSMFRAFRVMYDPDRGKNLYMIRDTMMNPHMKLPLEDLDPIAVRDYLLEFLPEDLDREGEYWSDRIQRWFKL